MALFDPDVARPRLAPSRRYSATLAHDTGKTSKLGHRAAQLPPRKAGDPPGDDIIVERKKPSTDHATLLVSTGHKPRGVIGQDPLTGAPAARLSRPDPSGLGDYPRPSFGAENPEWGRPTGAFTRMAEGTFGPADIAAVARFNAR